MPLIQLPAGQSPAVNPRDYAVVVGINHYAYGIPILDGAINDCELFCEWLVHPDMGGVDPRKIKFFISSDPTDYQPSKNQIEDVFIDLINLANDGTLDGRRLYLFLAGHGLASPPPDRRGCALIMANARMNQLRGLLGVMAADLMRLAGLFDEVMLVMDCCAEVSGPNPDISLNLPALVDSSLPSRAFLHVQAAPLGRTTAELRQDDPLDQSRGQRWQGVLTNALLRGLTTAVDADGDITARSLKTFLDATNIGQPQVDVGDANGATKSMVFGKARGLSVKVTSSSGATLFQIRDGAQFQVVIKPTPIGNTVYVSPGQYLVDGMSAAGVIDKSVPVSIREGGINVDV